MICLVPFIFAVYIGYLSFVLIHRKNPQGFLDIFILSIFGIGISAQLAFYQIALCNHFDGSLLILLNILILAILIMIRSQFTKQKLTNVLKETTLNVVYFILAISFFLWLSIILSTHNPYGDWDAWSFWNLRARYLLLSDVNWKDIYTCFGYGVKHPCLLSHWILWGWTWTGESTSFPIFTTSMLMVITAGILVYGLIEWTRKPWVSLLAGVYLCSIPYFLTHSISQYADIMVSFYLLACVLMLMRLIKDPQGSQAIWCGGLLGLLSFTKDEGILGAAILLVLISIFLRKQKIDKILIPLYSAYVLIFCATLMVKIWMMSTPSGINHFEFKHFFEWQRWVLIIKYFYHAYVNGGVILIPVLICFWRVRNKFDRYASFIVSFIIIFISCGFILYVLDKIDLAWRLNRTAYRVVYQILPLFIFLLFYCVFKKRDN